MSTKHTPGPWKTEDRRYLITDAPDEGSIGVYAGGFWIADVHGAHVGPKSRDEADANARLIAAAPELLEALEALLQNAENKAVYISILEYKECFDSEGNAIAEYSPEMDKARAAIAKAKGQL